MKPPHVPLLEGVVDARHAGRVRRPVEERSQVFTLVAAERISPAVRSDGHDTLKRVRKTLSRVRLRARESVPPRDG